MPGDFARQLTGIEPAHDLAWTSAVAAVVRSLYRLLPSGPSVLIGPNAHPVGDATGYLLGNAARVVLTGLLGRFERRSSDRGTTEMSTRDEDAPTELIG